MGRRYGEEIWGGEMGRRYGEERWGEFVHLMSDVRSGTNACSRGARRAVSVSVSAMGGGAPPAAAPPPAVPYCSSIESRGESCVAAPSWESDGGVGCCEVRSSSTAWGGVGLCIDAPAGDRCCGGTAPVSAAGCCCRER